MSGPDLSLPAPGAATVDAQNPWPGLLSFAEADRNYFRGRTAEGQDLLRLVRRQRLTVLFGVSGLGKSSLLKAGLFPEVRKEGLFPVYIRFDFTAAAPDLVEQAAEAIAAQAAESGIEAPGWRAGETLWEYLHRRDADFWDPRNRPVMPLLVFDQFEELFTLGRSNPERAAVSERFLEALADMVEGSVPAAVEERLNRAPEEAADFVFGRHAYKVLLSLREDFLPELEGLRRQMSGIAVNRMRLWRMKGETALLVVNVAPQLIDPDVAERVVRFVAAAPEGARLGAVEVEPAILSLVCRELNEKRKKMGAPKITAALLEGSQAEVLSNFYEESFIGLPPPVRELVEDNLLNVAGFRDSESLVNVLATPGVSKEAIERLIQRRLVRIENLGGERLELTHDVLTAVVRASRDRRRELALRAAERQQREEALTRMEQQRALARAKRDRKVALAMVLLFALAAGLALLAFRLKRVSDEKAREARENAQRAQQSAEEAGQSARQLAQALQDLQAAKAALEKAAKRDLSAAQAKANLQTRLAESEAKAKDELTAKNLQLTATAKDLTAANSRAVAAQETAESARARAEAAQTTAEGARSDALKAKQAVDRSLAQADVVEAGRRIDLGLQRDAFTYLARALENNPNSLAARSLIFDLLLRSQQAPDVSFNPNPPVRFDFEQIPVDQKVLGAVLDPAGARAAIAAWSGFKIWEGDRIHDILGSKIANGAAFSRDGNSVAAAFQDGTVQIWDAKTGKPQGGPLRHRGPVMSASFSHGPGPLRIVTASWDRTACIWDVQTGRRQEPCLLHPSPVTSASFSEDGTMVVTSAWDNSARIWNAADGKLAATILHSGQGGAAGRASRDQLNYAAFSPDGSRIVTAGADGAARVWEWKTGRPAGEALRHRGAINQATFDSRGLRIVTASDDHTARIWEAETGVPISQPFAHTDRVTTAAFGQDGHKVVTGAYDATVRIWRVRFETDQAGTDLLTAAARFAGGYDPGKLPALSPLSNRDSVGADLQKRLAAIPPGNDAADAVRWYFRRRP